jgi:predicted ATPase
MLARSGPIPTRGEWVFEVKWDGFRAIVSTEGAPLRVRDLLGETSALRDLGKHRLKDLSRPERIYQLQVEDPPTQFPPLKSLNRTNLPLVSTPLFGRDAELRQIQRLVKDGVRLITLTGPGGTGKTRLALQAAAELLEAFADGVFFVSVAPLKDVTLVRGAVAQALGLSADDDIAERLRTDHLLLVLDNVEHLGGIAEVVASLLVGGGVVILATGRSPLRLSSEHEFRVDTLSDAAAVELFVSRASSFGVRVDADEIAKALCRRLDNLPLAVELAAARTKHLSATSLLERLERALPLLTGGSSDVPGRQQTLRATIEWSHKLLSVDECAAFRRIAVFHGGCTIEAAESVCAADLDQLASLVDKSLLMANPEGRFLMLETIREYALERLDEERERDEILSRQARFYLEALQRIQPDLRGPRTLEFLAWFDTEVENLWAALATFLEHNEVEEAFTLADLLAPYWIARGRMSEGLRWLQDALAQRPDRSAARGRALVRIADLSNRLGHPEAGEAAAREALVIGKDFDDSLCRARALDCLVWIEYGRGNFGMAIASARSALDQALDTGDEDRVATANMTLASALSGSGEHLEEARQLFLHVLGFRRRIGDQTNVAMVLLNLSGVEVGEGEYRAAGRYAEEALELAREASAAFMLCAALGRVGHIALLRGDQEDAVARYAECLESAIEAEDGEVILFALEGIAFARADADMPTAIRIHGATRAIRAKRGIHLDRFDSKTYEPMLDRLSELVGNHYFESELEAGADLSEDQAIQLALGLIVRGGDGSDVFRRN